MRDAVRVAQNEGGVMTQSVAASATGWRLSPLPLRIVRSFSPTVILDTGDARR